MNPTITLKKFINRVSVETKVSVDELIELWKSVLDDTIRSTFQTPLVTEEPTKFPEDNTIETTNLAVWVDDGADWGCQFFYLKGPRANNWCLEKTMEKRHFCHTHKKHSGPRVEGPCSDTYRDIHLPYFRIHGYLGHYWYPRLNLGAIPTDEGMVVIGKILGNRWYKELDSDDIRRCQNVGLLYRVVPQSLLHDTYNIPKIDLDAIDAEGYTSYEVMKRERPSLYDKYLRIWNNHIQDRRNFKEYWQKKEWIRKDCQPPDWDEFDVMFKQSLEWDFEEGIPPFFVDYPNAHLYKTRPFPQTPFKIAPVDLINETSRTKHVEKDAQSFLAFIEKGHEWEYILNF